MLLIISHTIAEKELEPVKRNFSRKRIIDEARKIVGGLGVQIGSLHSNTLVKLYLTSVGGSARSIWAVNTKTNQIAIILFRMKKDRIGQNMTMGNPEFFAVLERNFEYFISDVAEEKVDFEVL